MFGFDTWQLTTEPDRDGEQQREGEPRTAEGELCKAVHGWVYSGGAGRGLNVSL